MYIAFKWLVTLAAFMWLVLCYVDGPAKTQHSQPDLNIPKYEWSNGFKNTTAHKPPVTRRPKLRGKFHDFQEESVAFAHYALILVSALLVTAYQKKYEIITYTKKTVTRTNIDLAKQLINEKLKKLKITALQTALTVLYKIYLWKQEISENLQKAFSENILGKHDQAVQRLNLLLIKKMTKLQEDRDNLAQLLVAAVQANKAIRSQYKLESMAKNRLVKHVESTQKQIKENRARYVNFQQLYIMTHQENLFLKARLKKLNTEKDETVKKFMNLISEIYKSDDNRIKSFCSKLILQDKESVPKSTGNVGDLLQNGQRPTTSAPDWDNETMNDMSVNLKSWPCTRVVEIMPQEENLMFLKTNEPKLKGLPGEYVWTVKDKDGLIERLYEYDCGFNIDTNETMQRIREYSVYHDKDCLLDYGTTLFAESESETSTDSGAFPGALPAPRRKFLTSSEPFKRFLANNKMRTRSRLSLCD